MRARIAVLATIALLVTSCAGAASSPALNGAATNDQEGSLTPATATASPETTSRPSQSESGPLAPNFQPDDFVEVTAAGLAVRSGPGIEFPLVSEYLLGRTEPLETTLLRGEVRLPAGQVVRVVAGPIVRAETAWFAVENVAQGGESGRDAPWWRTTAPVPYSEIDFQLTWMAVSQPGAVFARATDAPACTECFYDGPGPAAVAAGNGDGVVGPWLNQGRAWITVAAAANEPGDACNFSLAWEPGGDAPLIDRHLVDYFEAHIPGIQLSPDADEAALRISSNCVWAVVVRLATA